MWAALLCAVACVASLWFGGFPVIGGTLGAYAVITLGAAPRRFGPDPADSVGDLSYGAYVWAFPMQQFAAFLLGPAVSWWAITVISLGPTLALAWVSWHLFENPCLALKRLRKVDHGLCLV